MLFSRNHNDNESEDQDPVAMGPDVAEASRYYMQIRYAMLPYMYTLFYEANQKGTTVARPLFFEFPHDKATWSIDRQFMLGNALMVAPLLERQASDVEAYVPQGFWISHAQSKQSYYVSFFHQH